ncbi:DoxX family protein [Aquimarina aggregata]|uniref:DoxX family protein n=1 Tax=Aquimarina aggregata TaxID=1642818 RepID=UPI002492B19C|nr:DoxX family protein [Aquimarina aggregata]
MATGLLCFLFLSGAMIYIFSYSRAKGFFINLGFPTWIIYPLATLKTLGAIGILIKKSIFLKELAYAGFLFDAILALVAHIMVNDGEHAPVIISIALVTISWIYNRKVFGHYKQKVSLKE